MKSGWIRMFGVLGIAAAIVAIVFEVYASATMRFLYVIEYASGMPGLSGAFMLVCAIGLFLFGCYVVRWIADGFRSAGSDGG